jgi:hypothetical protein
MAWLARWWMEACVEELRWHSRVVRVVKGGLLPTGECEQLPIGQKKRSEIIVQVR